MRYLKPGRLYCFSPPVMLATFLIEVACAIYVLYRYKLTPVTRLASLILLSLAVFQLAEYNVCEGAFGVNSVDWARIGFVVITLLPPLGIHLIATMAQKPARLLIGLSYGFAAAFSLFFLTVGHGVEAGQCTGNYVIFSLSPELVALYSMYYYGLLLTAISVALRWAKVVRKASVRRALYGLAIGYIGFIVPTTVANTVDPASMAAIPSIMCGFAVILALVLTLYVIPEYMKARKGLWEKLKDQRKK